MFVDVQQQIFNLESVCVLQRETDSSREKLTVRPKLLMLVPALVPALMGHHEACFGLPPKLRQPQCPCSLQKMTFQALKD